VELTNVAVGAVTPNFTVDPDTKPAPFSVKVNAAPPTVALVGDIEVRVGTTLFTGNSTAPLDPPPGAGLLTTTGKDPAVAMSGAVTAIVTCVELTNVTVLAAALNVPVAPLTKLEPLMVRVKAAPPAVALVGENEVIVAAGFVMVKDCAAEVPPPGAGFVTVTFTLPPEAISAAGTVT
jgi:xanthosine utilization system XapX-like protein